MFQRIISRCSLKLSWPNTDNVILTLLKVGVILAFGRFSLTGFWKGFLRKRFDEKLNPRVYARTRQSVQ